MYYKMEIVKYNIYSNLKSNYLSYIDQSITHNNIFLIDLAKNK